MGRYEPCECCDDPDPRALEAEVKRWQEGHAQAMEENARLEAEVKRLREALVDADTLCARKRPLKEIRAVLARGYALQPQAKAGPCNCDDSMCPVHGGEKAPPNPAPKPKKKGG